MVKKGEIACYKLVTSKFSFSHNVFHNYMSLVHQNAAFCGNGLSSSIIIMIVNCYQIKGLRVL